MASKKAESGSVSIRVGGTKHADLPSIVERARKALQRRSPVPVDQSAALAWLMRMGDSSPVLSTNAAYIVALTADEHLDAIATALELGDVQAALQLVGRARAAIGEAADRIAAEGETIEG